MSDSITVSLNIFERKFLLLISSRGNEVDMNHNKISPQVIEALEALEKKGAITKFQLIGSNKSFQYKLTSIGSNLVDLIKAQSHDYI